MSEPKPVWNLEFKPLSEAEGSLSPKEWEQHRLNLLAFAFATPVRPQRPQRWNTRYQFLVSNTRYDLFRDWLRENDVSPNDACYIPMDERDRWKKIAGLGGYQKEQLIGYFSPEEIERLTR